MWYGLCLFATINYRRCMILSRTHWLALFYALLFSSDLVAQVQERGTPIPISDLTTLLEVVRQNNPDLKVSYLEAEALVHRSTQVSTLPDPRASVTYAPYPVFTARGTQRSQWRVDQAIPFPGKLQLRGDIADFGAEVSSYEALTFEQDLLFETKKTYFELYRLQQQEVLIRAFQEHLLDFEDNASIQYVVGTGAQKSILKAQLERNSLSTRLVSLELQKQSAIQRMARLLNTPVSSVDIKRLERPEMPALIEDKLVQIALEQRPEVKALEYAGKQADAKISLAEKAFFPDFGLSVTYFDVGKASIPSTATGRDALAFGVSLNIPIWRSKLNARLTEARLQKDQVRSRLESLNSTFHTQIADLVSQLVREREQLTLFQEALIPQAETSLEATLSSYTTGRTDFLDLLDAERMLFSLESGYEDAFARYLQAASALERALGIESLSELSRF